MNKQTGKQGVYNVENLDLLTIQTSFAKIKLT